ncbi:DNA polymerase III, subunit gamma and tau [Candidatus Wolfebacteria bacterium RIFCSPHIGHO2_01_FULL_48_22]|uniref:DNA polymerase III subunit gamma/tau n=2 Tax=Candidatus Wolfeibacteriota TaxID=1752735 RepID=A0A1F8DTA8_9BACT|nr:MAG: DNA polymerase III, subunit gamma and tau [Candidatus Wolfebacteria bacterium RIFCSPHIGHO2_01_FULL_48_22]OGM92660.1 MAG: DNA polymerase III, subunit gamma and tau [Candidatus Wolfebacteria bacterium RIFCSPLOWO2_01_FULL_47_17b]
MSIAIYRKYRPQTLADIIGQESVTGVLASALKQDKIAHAYLLYGPRGTGKTTIARIVAKAINCQNQKNGEPCNICPHCLAIQNNQALDVIEIDAASNRGIDEIRNLQELTKTLPAIFRYKVLIIDEVHMLTPQAFNALLKTLEEPPAHAVFILATTEYEKLPATIISRTQRYHFRRLTLQEIATKLKKICEAEKITFEPEALELIAHAADGGVRDAESLLDQISSMKGSVSTGHVEQVLGKVDFKKTSHMSGLIIEKNLENALEFLHEIHTGGHNVFQFNKDITEYLRRVLSLKLNPKLEELFSRDIAHSELQEIKQHALKADPEFLIKVIKSLIQAYTYMRYNPFPIAPFEIALIENLK